MKLLALALCVLTFLNVPSASQASLVSKIDSYAAPFMQAFSYPPRKTNVCAAFLLALKNTRASGTDPALAQLQVFEKERLPESDAVASDAGIRVISNQVNSKQLQAVAARVHGLEDDMRRIDGRNYNILEGHSYHGLREINEFISELQSQAQKLQSRTALWEALVSLWAGINYQLFFHASYYLTHAVTTNHLVNLALLGGTILVFAPDLPVRYVANLYQNFNGELTDLRNIAQSGSPDGWAYYSNTYKLTDTVRHKAWTAGQLNESDAVDADYVRSSSRVQVFNLAAKSLHKFAKEDWVQTDILLNFDSETKEPVLTVFVRSSLTKPVYERAPKRKTPARVLKWATNQVENVMGFPLQPAKGPLEK